MMCTAPVVAEHGIFNCGKCQSCQAKIRRDWQIRLLNELRTSKKGVVATLTYNNENLPQNMSLVKRDVQLFIKRVRKHLSVYDVGRKIKYFCAGEYGDLFGRPHYHIILFNIGLDERELIDQKWNKGFIKVDLLSYSSIKYVTKYLQKPATLRGRSGNRIYKYTLQKEPPFRTMSQGIGMQWFIENIIDCLREKCIRWFDKVVALPRAYRRALMLTAEDFPEFFRRQQEFLKRFFEESKLSKSERMYYEKYGIRNFLSYKHLRENVKNYFKALDKHSKLMYYEYK